MNPEVRNIEEFFRRRTGREAIYLPSGRMALYLAFREWLRPGARILMSPANDDVVFFTVLAAGLHPVIGPLDPRTGNLDPDRVGETTWNGLQAVLTTNLYGFPDRMDRLMECSRKYGLLLIEDACQALDTRFGDQRIGEFSPVSAYSLSKHLNGTGGILGFRETERRDSLLRRANQEIGRRTRAGRVAYRVRLSVRSVAEAAGVRERLARVRDRIFPRETDRIGHRMPYDADEVLQARRNGSNLNSFERWVRVDNRAYRTEPSPAELKATFRLLESFEENRIRRIEGTRKIRNLPGFPTDLAIPDNTAMFRVPLFVLQRDKVVCDLAKRRMKIDHIYDPPLDRYASPELAVRLSSVPGARIWTRDILPVNPIHADRFLDALCTIDPLQGALPSVFDDVS